jgi:hypothetical protein
MIVTNKLKLPEGFVRAVDTVPHNRPGSISATTLLRGVKEIILTERHWNELTVDVADEVWKVWGTAVHSLLEEEGETEFTEIKLEAHVHGIDVTGRLDNYDMAHGVITDYKTASTTKILFGDFSDWRRQGLIYAWLLRKNGMAANKVRFVALLKDHSKSKARFDRRYPQSPTFIYEFDVTYWDIEETGQFVALKTAACLSAGLLTDDSIPPCSPDERWASPEKFAVMKKGRKTAVRLFDTWAEADQKLQQENDSALYIDHRPGTSRKCEDYCMCCQFCNFYKEQVAP